MSDVTQLLFAIQLGDAQAQEKLLAIVYEELRRLAHSKMAREQPGHTLQPTDLVGEAWLKLVDENGQVRFGNRAHFFGAAAEAMRRILIDRARRKQAERHGGGQEHVDVEEVEIPAPVKDDELLAVHEFLDRLAIHHMRKAEFVKLRYFVGLSIEDAANVLGVSEETAKRDWTYARAWLAREIRPNTASVSR